MAKKVTGYIKLQIPAAKATPAPPVGPALGQHGVNIMGFCKEFNEKTASQAGLIIPVVITVYQDRSFTFITKTPPAAVLLKKACGIESDYESLGGLIIEHLDRLPNKGDSVTIDNCKLTVIKMDDKRIELVKVIVTSKEDDNIENDNKATEE